MSEHPTDPLDRSDQQRPADQPPSLDPSAPASPADDEAARQAQDTLRSISRLEESN